MKIRITFPFHLSDDALVAEVTSLAGRVRETTVQLVAHLAELDNRRLHLRAGFSSLFCYCREILRLSESEAYNRIEAARTARKFPLILEMLVEGTLNLTTVRLLSPHLTEANYRELLASAAGKSKREVLELLARHHPRPDVAPSVRKLPAPKALPAPETTADPGETAVQAPVPTHASPPPSRPVVSPLAPDRFQIRFTASASTCEKLRLAQDLLRHAISTGDTAEVIDRALTLLLQDLARKKFAATDHPRQSRGTAPGSRGLPAALRRLVWRRDDGRCAYVGAGGRRCNTRAFLEFHHLDPYGVGGEPTVDNIELRCRAHNNYEAELFYGRRWPERATRSGTSRPSASVPVEALADAGGHGGAHRGGQVGQAGSAHAA